MVDHVLTYISLVDLEIICWLGLLYVASAAIIFLLSLYYKEIEKIVLDSISGTSYIDYYNKYFLFIFSVKAVEYYI